MTSVDQIQVQSAEVVVEMAQVVGVFMTIDARRTDPLARARRSTRPHTVCIASSSRHQAFPPSSPWLWIGSSGTGEGEAWRRDLMRALDPRGHSSRDLPRTASTIVGRGES